jgi:hypothetical protein
VTEIQEKKTKKTNSLSLSLSRLLIVSPLSHTHTTGDQGTEKERKKNKKDYKLEFIHDSSGG